MKPKGLSFLHAFLSSASRLLATPPPDIIGRLRSQRTDQNQFQIVRKTTAGTVQRR